MQMYGLTKAVMVQSADAGVQRHKCTAADEKEAAEAAMQAYCRLTGYTRDMCAPPESYAVSWPLIKPHIGTIVTER